MRKLFKTFVSIILSLTFIFSYLNLMTSEVSADTATVTNSISEGVVYTSIDTAEDYLFTPSKSGYYYFESDLWGDLYKYSERIDEFSNETYHNYEPMNWLNVIPLGYGDLISQVGYIHVYYLTAGETYAAQYSTGGKFSVRYIDRYVKLEKSADLTYASLDTPFTLSISATSSVALDDIRYTWTDIPSGNIGYYDSSVTLNLSQLLDSHNRFYYSCDGYESCGDFGRGFVSVCVEAVYKQSTYTWYVSFDIEGYASVLSSNCRAYESNDEYEHYTSYRNLVDFDGYEYDLFSIITDTDDDCDVSFQWCKVDTARLISGEYTTEYDLYKPLKGETSNSLSWSKSLAKLLGEPYCTDFDTDSSIYHDVVCLVTFKRGDDTLIKSLKFKIVYSADSDIDGLTNVDVELGSKIKFPDVLVSESGNPGRFVEYVPEGITYRYMWYDCGSIPEYMGYGYTGWDPNSYDINDEIEDVTYLGTGKDFNIDTSGLTMFSIDNEDRIEYVSYVACFAQPMYNGHVCHDCNFHVCLYVFELHYGTFKFDSWTSSATPCIGDELFLDVYVDSIGPVTYQWQKQLDEGWIKIYSSTYDTNEYWMTVDEDSFGLYRCAVTDEFGNTIYSEPCEVSLYDGPVILCQPEDFAGYVGETAKFKVVASGNSLNYQWQLKKGNSWANLTSGGATTDTLSVKIDATKDGKVYRCVITDPEDQKAWTDEVMITVKEPAIEITSQPKSYSGPVGSTAKFSVAADGEGLTYQWQLKKGSKWADLSTGGAKTPTMSVKVDDSKNGKIYRCLITNVDGEQLASDEVKITVKDPDINITSQPTDFTGLEGSTAKFTVAAEGEGLTYQWQLKKGSSWADLSSGGAKTATMSIKADASKNGKIYRCLITNAAGEQLATNEVSITIKEPSNAIVITKQPTDASTTEGGSLGLIVEAEGEGLTYQWQLKKGSTWANLTSGGATTNWLSLGKCDLSKNGKVYRCVITDINGEQVVTREAKITVYYELPQAVPCTKTAEPAPDAVNEAAPETTAEPAPEPVSEAPAENEAPAPVEATAPAPVEEPADPPAEAPAEEA